VLSLYLTLDAALAIQSEESRIERISIAANLRHHEIEPWFHEQALQSGEPLPVHPFRDELVLLWRFAECCEYSRGKSSAMQDIRDYSFDIEGDLARPDSCRVAIALRPRGSPLDKLVAEMMIIANTRWSARLANAGVPCLYRAQTGGKARMTTAPQAHEGVGVPQYAWMTSPLRRYADMVNQWQLAAHLGGTQPPFAPRSAELFAAMRDFEAAYAAYAEFQRKIERYWSLRWLQQENITVCELEIRHDDLARFVNLPLFTRLPGSGGNFNTGTRVQATVESIDLLKLEVRCRLCHPLAEVALAKNMEVEYAGSAVQPPLAGAE
jgi:exoribonuclease-2